MRRKDREVLEEVKIDELKWKPKYDKLEQIIETAWNWHKNHPNGYED